MRSLRIQRILFLVLATAFVLGKVNILLIYVAIYYLSFEYLNSNKKYLETNLHKVYNWLYVTYLAFIVYVRSGLFKFDEEINYNLNTAEHIFFMLLICQTFLIYMQLFGLLSGKHFFRLITVFIFLNLIGIINEFFQNFYHQLSIFILEQDDLKDLKINLIGSSLFVAFSIFCKSKAVITRHI